MITNPIDRLPLALKATRDYLIGFLAKNSLKLILLIATAVAILMFADSRDFIISCDEYSIDSGIACPVK
jgi:hypothetical protein